MRGLRYENRKYTIKESEYHIIRLLTSPCLCFSIKQNNSIIGRIGVSFRDQKWHIWYWIIPEKQGNGYSKEALGLFINAVNIRPLCAEVHEWNIVSSKLLLSFDFKEVYKGFYQLQ